MSPQPRKRGLLFSLAWRESRTTRRRLLLYMSSIALGVAALVGIDSFAANIIASVREQSRALVGGDVSFRSRRPWPPAIDTMLRALPGRGIEIARVTTFASMAVVPRSGATRLAQVRAVTANAPLYGAVTTSPPGQWGRLNADRRAVVDPGLLVALQAQVGDSIGLGFIRFEIIGTIDNMPGDPGIETAVAPRVYIAERFIDETRLLTFGSRADYSAYARISRGTAEDLVKVLKPTLDSNQVRARTAGERESGLTEGISVLTDFLGIVGVVALLLGGIGVASGVNAWVRRKIDTVAVLRCLGASSRQVMTIYVTQAVVMGLLGAMMGAALGIGIQIGLPRVIKDFLPVDVAVTPVPGAIGMGIALGVWIALAFALRPLLTLRRISPLQALRREANAAPLRSGWRDGPSLTVNVLLAASVIGVAATRSSTPGQIWAFALGIGVVIGALSLSAWGLTRLARRSVRRSWPYVVRQGIANLYRPANQTRSVVLSLGFGAFLMTTLYVVQANLLKQLSLTESASRGNLVFFDVQQDQVAGVDSLAAGLGNEVVERTPIVTMRISAIQGKPVAALQADSSRARWALRREFRSSYRGSLSSAETVVAGRWHGEAAPPAGTTVFEFSLEREVASDLNLALGDTVTWDVQGVSVVSRLTSLRTVNWARFEANFFAVFQPGALERAPQMFAVLVRTPTDAGVMGVQRAVVERFPNVASIDLSLVRRTVGEITDRATLAIRFLALFSLAMGVPVLFSAVAATRRERVREGVLLKVLGATRRQIGRILVAEYFALGLLGSLTGMVLSFGGAWALVHFVFDRPFDWAAGAAAAIAGAMLGLTVSIGLLSGRDVFHETPMGALREV